MFVNLKFKSVVAKYTYCFSPNMKTLRNVFNNLFCSFSQTQTLQNGPKRMTRHFWNGAIPFLCNGISLFQCNLPKVLPILILKHSCCLSPYMDLFLFLCREWSCLVLKDGLKDFQKYSFQSNVFLFAATVLKIVNNCYIDNTFFNKYNYAIHI